MNYILTAVELLKLMWNKVLIFIWFLFLLSCATPRAWVISQYDGGGAIGYQNYNPASDGGQLISNLLQCIDHKRTWNGIKQGYATPTTYQAYSNGYGSATVVPLDGGAYEWAEYHYQCNQNNKSQE